jgi:hypothetical protein
MARITRSLVMAPEDLTRALLEELEVGKTPSSPDLLLHHAPKAVGGGEMMATRSGEEGQAILLLPMGERRCERVRPVEATAVETMPTVVPR